VAQKGNFFTTSKVKKVDSKGSWIVDFGASNHMTGDISLIQDFTPCFENHTMRIANGSISRVFGTSYVVILENLTLESILLIPNLNCNLLCSSQLTWEKTRVTNFFLTQLCFSIFEFEIDDWQC